MGTRPTAAAGPGAGYGRGARILSIGIASTGLVTFAYFAVASHVLGEVDYKGITLLWSIVFVIVSVIYRPVEQLLSRTIASARAVGSTDHPLRVPLALQAGFAGTFLAVVLPLREPLVEDVFDGASTLYWVLVASVLAYAASYFARGWLAGHQRFALYGGLVLFESCSRFAFPLAAAIGIASGQDVVALGIVAAPFVSLLVVLPALTRRARRNDAPAAAAPDDAADGRQPTPAGGSLTLRTGGTFAAGVLGIMLAEQALINGAVLTVDATVRDAALAGFVFNVLLIARAPLQLFQAVQTSLLPHLAGLAATAGAAEFHRAIRLTLTAIAAFAGAVALVLLAIGPWAMDLLFGGGFDYDRVGLAIVALGMGCHLAAGTLNQAALALGRATVAAAAWLACAAGFLVWVAVPVIDDVLLRVEVGYLGATAVLALLLLVIDRRAEGVAAAAAPERATAGV